MIVNSCQRARPRSNSSLCAGGPSKSASWDSIVLRLAFAWLLALGVFASPGCGRARHAAPVAAEDDSQEIDKEGMEIEKEIEREQRQLERLERLQSKRIEAEDRAEREAEGAKERTRKSEEHKRGAALCAELLGDLRADLTITPAASVKKLLGDNYAVELRGGPDATDLKRLAKAQAARDWLEVLSILQGKRVTEYPDEREIMDVRRDFLDHQFLVLIKTPLDLSRTSAISLSENGWELEPAAPVRDARIEGRGNYAYVNGKRVYGASAFGGGRLEWQRHPDGSGWYFTWAPNDGEVILVPNIWDILQKECGGLKRLYDDAAMKRMEKYGPILVGVIVRLRENIPHSLRGRTPEDAFIEGLRCDAGHPAHVVNARVIADQLDAIGPRLQVLGFSDAAQKDALFPYLEEKFKLGELSEKQVLEAVDKACLERFLARRKALLAL